MWTIGHSTLSLDELYGRLAGHRIERVADVRRYPASRRHPHVNRETLATFLGARRIRYRWFERLGGRRQGFPSASPRIAGCRPRGVRRRAFGAGGLDFRGADRDLVRRIGLTPLPSAIAGGSTRNEGWIVHHVIDATTSEGHEVWDLARETPRGLAYPPLQSELDLGT